MSPLPSGPSSSAHGPVTVTRHSPYCPMLTGTNASPSAQSATRPTSGSNALLRRSDARAAARLFWPPRRRARHRARRRTRAAALLAAPVRGHGDALPFSVSSRPASGPSGTPWRATGRAPACCHLLRPPARLDHRRAAPRIYRVTAGHTECHGGDPLGGAAALASAWHRDMMPQPRRSRIAPWRVPNPALILREP
jgi:hypothetical protein